jgi:nitrite reductase (NO-forming)/hydroxylamine reductase
MPHIRLKPKQVTIVLAVLPFVVGIALAADQPDAKEGHGGAEVKYQVGGSLLAGEEMHQNINPKV